jgi:hypothetical protein
VDRHVHRPARGDPLGLISEAASTIPSCAGVSKLAAEMDSKSIAGNRVRVRVPPPALAISGPENNSGCTNTWPVTSSAQRPLESSSFAASPHSPTPWLRMMGSDGGRCTFGRAEGSAKGGPTTAPQCRASTNSLTA